MSYRAFLLLMALLLLPATPAGAGTSVGGGTSTSVVHFIQLMLRKLGFTEREAESCNPTEEQIERRRAARSGRLPGVGRQDDSSDPCTSALDHALEVRGDAVRGSIGAQVAAPKYAPGSEEQADLPGPPASIVRPAN